MRALSFLSLVVAVGLVLPAHACRFSRPIFAARSYDLRNGVETRVRVNEALRLADGSLLAVRATVLTTNALFRRGERITIIVSTDTPDDCYYFGFVSPAAVQKDGSLLAFVDLDRVREPSGAYATVTMRSADRARYRRFLSGKLNARWAASGFKSELAE